MARMALKRTADYVNLSTGAVEKSVDVVGAERPSAGSIDEFCLLYRKSPGCNYPKIINHLCRAAAIFMDQVQNRVVDRAGLATAAGVQCKSSS